MSKKNKKFKKKDKKTDSKEESGTVEIPLSSFLSNILYYYLYDKNAQIIYDGNPIDSLSTFEQEVYNLFAKTLVENNIKDSCKFPTTVTEKNDPKNI